MRRGYCERCKMTYATDGCAAHPDEPLLDLDDAETRQLAGQWARDRLLARYERWVGLFGAFWGVFFVVVAVGGAVLSATARPEWLKPVALVAGILAIVWFLLFLQTFAVHSVQAIVKRFTREPFMWNGEAGMYAEHMVGSMGRKLRLMFKPFVSVPLEDVEDPSKDVPADELVRAVIHYAGAGAEEGVVTEQARLSYAAMAHPNFVKALPSFTRNALYFDLDWYLAWHEARRSGRPLPVAGPKGGDQGSRVARGEA